MQCKYFNLAELLPKTLYEKLKHEDKLWVGWMLFDERALKTLDKLRDKFGSAIVNNWNVKTDWLHSKYNYSGYRQHHCSVGAVYSQHRFGRAFDVKFKDYHSEEGYAEIREYVLRHPTAFKFLTCLEMNIPNWFHFDCRNYDEPPFLIFPK